MEIAHVEQTTPEFVAFGTQLGVRYELRYHLAAGTLHLELVGERRIEVRLDEFDFFDLGWSPLFNSLPVVRDHLLDAGPARDYVMRRVDVPSLEIDRSDQRYEPLGGGVVRIRTDGFVSNITFDEDGFVVDYPGIGKRA